ncbi:MAG: cytochrome c peroxidase [Rhodoferax sp.]|nr:cytochrome c peroxidase [Rhodoferax sp.]
MKTADTSAAPQQPSKPRSPSLFIAWAVGASYALMVSGALAAPPPPPGPTKPGMQSPHPGGPAPKPPGAAPMPMAAASKPATLPAMPVAAAPTPAPAASKPVNTAAPVRTALQDLGEKIFNDTNLSEPRGTACASCHSAATGFANLNGSRIGVPRGSRPNVVGTRAVIHNSYSSFTPAFGFRVRDGDVDPVGGLFWDGRVDTLTQQAQGPFLAPLEMNNKDAASVVAKIAASKYAGDMSAVFGPDVFKDSTKAFQRVAEAIAAYETTSKFQSFSSSYDQFVAGKTQLTPTETSGMNLFMDPAKGNCASCHTMNPKASGTTDNLFTDFGHYANGIPRNKDIPANANPSYFDLGLCGPQRTRPALSANIPASVSVEKFCGTFKMPSLRNVAQRQALMHNGFFKNLRDVVSFYATRNSDPKRWYGAAGVANDLPAAYLANIVNDRAPFDRAASAGPALSEREIDDVVAFLKTLSDQLPPPQSGTPPAAAPAQVAMNPFAPMPPPAKAAPR